jgi:hydroxyacylglutathione hydrolase
MRAYMASLDRLMARPERRYLPGHGGIIGDGKSFAAALADHRRERENAILARLAAGDRRIAEIVAHVYRDTDRQLHGAAALSVLAHLEALIESGIVTVDRPAGLDADFALA